MAKILIAEDERDIRDLVAFTLRFAGHEVVAVGNGAEAVETARLEIPDLILMDVRMPRMTGYEACEKDEGRSAACRDPGGLSVGQGPGIRNSGWSGGRGSGVLTQTLCAI